MQQVAASAGIPGVGVDEFVRPGMDYAQWLLAGLDAADGALKAQARVSAPRAMSTKARR